MHTKSCYVVVQANVKSTALVQCWDCSLCAVEGLLMVLPLYFLFLQGTTQNLITVLTRIGMCMIFLFFFFFSLQSKHHDEYSVYEAREKGKTASENQNKLTEMLTCHVVPKFARCSQQ